MKTRKACASCLNFKFNKTIKTSKNLKPKWLNKIDYVDEFIKKQTNFNNKYPAKFNKVLKIYINKKYKNRKLLYWCASPPTGIIINKARDAYGNFNNSGIANIDNDGYAIIKFMIPQNYKTIEKNKKKYTSFFKHIHYTVSNTNNDKWSFNVYTKLIENTVSLKELINKLHNKSSVILNVLPSEYYAKDHINNTYNLPYNSIKNYTISYLHKWFYEIIKLHYSKLYKLISNKKLDIYEIPIICYCAHNKCNASKIASQLLMKKGFINVSIYEDGMKGYKSKKF